MQHPESKLQQAVVKWFALQHKGIPMFAIPNGGYRNKREAVRMISEGTLAGVPDLCIPVKKGQFGALYVELKTKTGKLTEQQKIVHQKLTNCGNFVAVCRSTEEFMQVVNVYLNLM